MSLEFKAQTLLLHKSSFLNHKVDWMDTWMQSKIYSEVLCRPLLKTVLWEERAQVRLLWWSISPEGWLEQEQGAAADVSLSQNLDRSRGCQKVSGGHTVFRHFMSLFFVLVLNTTFRLRRIVSSKPGRRWSDVTSYSLLNASTTWTAM